MKKRRRRGVLLLSLALACGGLASSEVSSRTRAVEERVGPLVPVVAARAAIEPGTKLSPGLLTVVRVPARYAPPDALADPEQADGLRTGGALEAGSYLTASALAAGPEGGSAEPPGNGLGRGERAIELRVAGAEALGDLAGPGARVDVLVTTESGERAGRTELALEDVELLALRGGEGGGSAEPPGSAASGSASSATATLRVTLKQAVYLTAAQNFAREVRVLPRAAGDRRRSGHLVAGAGL
jgi:pilus assembly protein CpaB